MLFRYRIALIWAHKLSHFMQIWDQFWNKSVKSFQISFSFQWQSRSFIYIRFPLPFVLNPPSNSLYHWPKIISPICFEYLEGVA